MQYFRTLGHGEREETSWGWAVPISDSGWLDMEAVFHWGCLQLRLSSIEVVFHRGCLPKRLSSIEVVFHVFKIDLYSIRVDLHMLKGKFVLISSYFTTCPGGWWVGGEKLKIKLNSAQLELDLGLSLAIYHFCFCQFNITV
jgi:hypothetical protein